MFHIKICGIRTPADANAAASAGADAVGLNFFPSSVRYVDPADAATGELSAAAASAGLLRVGVFVNESPSSIGSIAKRVGLDAIQIHGDETVEIVSDLKQLDEVKEKPLIRAIKLSGHRSPEEIHQAAQPWADVGCHLLIDADAGSAHGGIGRVVDWDSVKRWADNFSDVSWTLAGGLTPGNVGEAIARSGATSVDTASGVEDPRGVKSAKMIEGFVAEARRALDSQAGR